MMSYFVSMFNAIKPFRGKQRVLAALFKWIPFSHAKSYYGVNMVKNIHDSTWRACMVGSYGPFISDYIKSINVSFKFLDIGSNQGLFALCAANNENCHKIIAFEPNPDTFSLLSRNIALSKYPHKFHPVCAAVSSGGPGVMEMAVPLNHSGASTSQGTDNKDARHFLSVIVQGQLLKEVINPQSDEEIHAKIDVEGAEIFVLNGLLETNMLDAISSIIIEVSDNITGSGHIDDIISFFETHGWQKISRNEGDIHYDAVYINPKFAAV